MSLVLTFNVCSNSNCKTVNFNETTGTYNVTTNPTGWGTPNATIASATTATLTITKPDTTEIVINLFSTYPTTDSTLLRTITQTELENTGKLTDGLYTFLYTVTANSVVYTQTIQKLLYCQITCCVNNMWADVAKSGGCLDCDSIAKDKARKAQALLSGLESVAEAGNKDAFDNILSVLTKLCNSSNCSSC